MVDLELCTLRQDRLPVDVMLLLNSLTPNWILTDRVRLRGRHVHQRRPPVQRREELQVRVGRGVMRRHQR